MPSKLATKRWAREKAKGFLADYGAPATTTEQEEEAPPKPAEVPLLAGSRSARLTAARSKRPGAQAQNSTNIASSQRPQFPPAWHAIDPASPAYMNT